MKPVDPDAIRLAWRRAGDDLGIEVETEPALVGDAVSDAVVIVRSFGRPLGTAIIAPQAPADVLRVAEEHGFFVCRVRL